MSGPGRILLVSCYELGRPPLGAAWPLAFLERSGFSPSVLDLGVEPFDPGRAAGTRLALLSAPMHTALRIGVRAAEAIRAASPGCSVIFFGHYAALNADHLLGTGIADAVAAGECEEALVRAARAVADGRPLDGVPGLRTPRGGNPAALGKLDFPAPSRGALPPLARYARLADGQALRLAGAVEASRGCLHLCRHCPIPPVYGGRFFAVPREIVLADIRRLVEQGARHVTFADPDFLNGPRHALEVARSLHAGHPGLTFDFTTKVEHILRHRGMLPELRALGCVFVVSAVESLSDEVLRILDKGHTRAGALEALRAVRGAGLSLRPSLVPFTPWSTLRDYLDILDFVEQEGLEDEVDPVQLSVRLLIPPGSLLLARPETTPHLRGLRAGDFTWVWEHPDPRMDRLQEAVAARVDRAGHAGEDPRATLAAIRTLAEAAAGVGAGDSGAPDGRPPAGRAAHRPPPPRLTESWFC